MGDQRLKFRFNADLLWCISNSVRQCIKIRLNGLILRKLRFFIYVCEHVSTKTEIWLRLISFKSKDFVASIAIISENIT